uniref:MLX-interacting protein-like n=1 Tax=Hirondellea gigas TaxID=1518452 RepID=A0A6A7FP01_9CRUS
MLAGRGIMHHGLPSVPEEDFYTSDVEAAGLPPSTTNTPPSYSSSTSSPPPSSLDYLHPHHQQARLTTIESITPQHPTHDIIAAVSSNNTYDASNTCTNYDSSSTSANNYDRSSKSVTANYDTSNTSAATNYDGSSTSATTNYDTSNTSAATNYDRSSSSTTSYDRPSSSTTSYDNSSTTTASYDGSSSNTNYSNSSSANSYPDARISDFRSVMEVGNPSAVKTLSSSSFSSYTPCLSLVPSSTPSPPAAHTGSSQVLAHPPQITTPMVFPLHHSSYDCNQQQQHPAEAEVALGSSSHVVRTSDTNAAVTHTNNADNTRYMSQISRSSSLPQLQIQQQQQHSQQQATLRQQNSPTNALQQQQQQHSHSSRHHTRHQQHRRHSDNNLPHMSRALLRQDRQQSNIKQQQTNTKQQQPPLQQPQLHRLIVKSFSQQEFAKLPSPPPQLSPNSARFSPTQHASPNQSPSARHQQLSSGFAVPKLCPRRRSHSSGTSSHSASSNNSSSSSAAAAVVLSPTGLHAQPTTPSVAHYQLLQQQQHSPATADVAAAPTACAWPFLPPHSPSIVNASSSGSAATKLIAPATTTSPAAFFTQLVTKGEPSEQLQGSLQNPGIGSSQLVFGTPSNTISNSQAPVKLSFVIPGICPPLIPLTSVTTLSTPLSTSNKTFSSFNTGGPLSLKPFTSEGAVGTPVTASQFKLSSGSSPTHVTTTGAATIFASPLTIASSPLYAGNTTLSSSVITNSSSNSLPHVTLSPVTPSSLKSIPQAQLFLAAGGPNPALNLPSYIGAHTFKSSPPHAGLSSPIPSPPNKAFRPKNDHELVQYRERRRMCHINAEKKRRCSIKSNFEMLHVLIPSTSSSCNSKISKAALLNKGADYITQLKSERSQLAEQIQERKAELERLAAQISAAQSQLPATGAPMTHSRHNKLEQMYSDYVRERTLQSWKFYIFSMLGETLLDSFNANVSTASVEDLSRSALAWLDQHCSLNLLRPVVSNTMLRLSTTTSVLATPQNLPEDIYNLVAKHEEKNNTTATNNNNSGSSSNSSRSSSLVRQ